MPYDLSKKFVIAISSRALFDASRENDLFESRGQRAYDEHQLKFADQPLEPGPAFGLIKAMLALNKFLDEERRIEVVLLSRNSAAAGIRVNSSIRHHNLDISRSAFTTGDPIAPLLDAFCVDLFLSAFADDVHAAFKAGHASALMYGLPRSRRGEQVECIKIAFDGDSVLFSDESERIYQDEGMEAFHINERNLALTPLKQGPFAKVLISLAYIQRRLPSNAKLIKTSIVTARNAPSDSRVLYTLRDWGVQVDHVYFMGGVQKSGLLKAINPHIFFDDQPAHCVPASVLVPTAQVPSNLFTLSGAVSPSCPQCGGEMTIRKAFRGPTAGKRFFGCKSYPSCRGSVSIA